MRIIDRIRAIFSGANDERLFAVPTTETLAFIPSSSPPEDDHWKIESPLAIHALGELVNSGVAFEQEGGFQIAWGDLYSLLNSRDRSDSLVCLGIPPIGKLRPRLKSSNSLDDPDFEIAIEGWLDGDSRTTALKLGAVARAGGKLQLLSYASYNLTKAVNDFWRQTERTADSNRLHWGRIRTLAIRADAGLDQFLVDTVVLTPEKLQIKLVNTDVGGAGVVEVQPWFAGAPDVWLSQFDRASKVRDRYQFVTERGLIEVLITPQVKTVLSAIKAMPGRRAAGVAAERFLQNPFSALGPDAASVLDEEQFDSARHEAGIEFERFVARVDMRSEE